MSNYSENSIDELLTRGVVDVIDRTVLEKRLRDGERLRIKLGIDPTGPLIHIGRATLLYKLRQFQQLGHHIQLVVGNFTGMLGDPSDKTADRRQLTAAEVQKNMQQYIEQIGIILDIASTEIVYNADWLGVLRFDDIIRLAANFTVQQMLERENFHVRHTTGKPIYLHELLYPLMQGYDSVVLRSDVEIGGTDQLFNMLAGRTLQERADQPAQCVMTCPLLLGADGQKMSTSAGNTIHMLDNPQKQYFALMRLNDDLIAQYYATCTTVHWNTVRAYEEKLANGTLHPRAAKMELAYTIVEQWHGTVAASNAAIAFEQEVRRGQPPQYVPERPIAYESQRLDTFLAAFGMANSRAAAKHLIEQGAVSVDDQRINQPAYMVTPKSGMLLHVGKSGWQRVQ